MRAFTAALVSLSVIFGQAQTTKAGTKEDLADFKTSVKILEFCPTDKTASQPKLESAAFSAALPAIFLNALLKPVLSSGIDSIGKRIAKAGQSTTVSPVPASVSQYFYEMVPDSGIAQIKTVSNPGFGCIVVAHGKTSPTWDLAVNGNNGNNWDNRNNPIGEVPFFTSTKFAYDINGQTQTISLKEFIENHLGVKRLPEIYAEFKIETGPNANSNTAGNPKHHSYFRLSPKFIYLAGRNAGPFGSSGEWQPTFSLSLTALGDAAPQDFTIDLQRLRSLYPEGVFMRSANHKDNEEILRDFAAFTEFAPLPGVPKHEQDMLQEFKRLNTKSENAKLAAEKSRRTQAQNRANLLKACNLWCGVYAQNTTIVPPGTPTIAGEKNFQAFARLSVETGKAGIKLLSDIAALPDPNNPHDTVSESEKRLNALKAVEWKKLEVARLHALGGDSRCFSLVEETTCTPSSATTSTVPAPQAESAASSSESATPPTLTVREQNTLNELKTLLFGKSRYTTVTASVHWTSAPNQFLITLGNALSEQSEEVATALAEEVLKTDTDRVSEQIAEMTADTEAQVAALNTISAFYAAATASLAAPENTSLALSASAALLTARSKCDILALQGSFLPQCAELPATFP